MKTFQYTITDPVGIHLRTVTPLIKKVKEFPVTVHVSGDNEEAAAAALEAFFRENL